MQGRVLQAMAGRTEWRYPHMFPIVISYGTWTNWKSMFAKQAMAGFLAQIRPVDSRGLSGPKGGKRRRKAAHEEGLKSYWGGLFFGNDIQQQSALIIRANLGQLCWFLYA